MKLPEFTAEASLHKSGAYCSVGATGTPAGSVLPQQGGICEAACLAQYIGCLAATPWGVLSLGCTVVFGNCLRNCPPPPPPPCTYMGTCSGSNSDTCVQALCGACPGSMSNCLTKCSWRWSYLADACDIYCCVPTISEPS
jgi:hypothetical protein